MTAAPVACCRPSDRDFSFDLPSLIREFPDLHGCFLRRNLNEKEVLSLLAVNPGLTDHGGGSRVTWRYQTWFLGPRQGSGVQLL